MQAKDAVGRYGEKVAALRLADRGWRVLDRNWRGTRGELDIIALDGDALVAVEVKTRRGTNYGHPAEAVTAAKLARLRRLTGEWLTEHREQLTEHQIAVRSIRIDVVAIIIPRGGSARVEHLVGVSI